MLQTWKEQAGEHTKKTKPECRQGQSTWKQDNHEKLLMEKAVLKVSMTGKMHTTIYTFVCPEKILSQPNCFQLPKKHWVMARIMFFCFL